MRQTCVVLDRDFSVSAGTSTCQQIQYCVAYAIEGSTTNPENTGSSLSQNEC